MLVYTDSRLALPGLRSEYNEKSHDHTVAVQAARYLRERPGVVGVVERSQLPLLVYLGAKRVVVVPDGITAPEAQENYLRQHPVDYIFETDAQPFFDKYLRQQAPRAVPVQNFSTPVSSTTARLYDLR